MSMYIISTLIISTLLLFVFLVRAILYRRSHPRTNEKVTITRGRLMFVYICLIMIGIGMEIVAYPSKGMMFFCGVLNIYLLLRVYRTTRVGR